MMNTTFKVATIHNCEDLVTMKSIHDAHRDICWVQTFMGCQVILMLKEMYKFNVTYIYGDAILNNTDLDGTKLDNTIVPDIFARPTTVRFTSLREGYYPIQAINSRRYGFLLRRLDSTLLQPFYSQPFTRPAWNCLYAMAVLVFILFYVLSKWERRVTGRRFECSLSRECLLVIGAYCQHILPVQLTLPSRRIAYFTFLLYSYVVYSFYTSNLRSHLVNSQNAVMSLEYLTHSKHRLLMLQEINLNVTYKKVDHEYSLVRNLLNMIEMVNLTDGLEAMRTGKTAVFTEYYFILPYIKKYFSTDEICDLVRVDVFAAIKEYLVTSTTFPYKEQFKVGTLRMKETGLIRRLMVESTYAPPPHCSDAVYVHTCLFHILYPLAILGVTYTLAFLIMIGERMHFQRNRVWPYVD